MAVATKTEARRRRVCIHSAVAFPCIAVALLPARPDGAGTALAIEEGETRS